jgi:WXG100 family type VII secretion target
MGDLKVSGESMLATANSIDGSAADLHEEFNRIRAAAEEVIGSSWTGQAADGIRIDWTRWCEGFEDVMAGLRREAELLRTAASKYHSTDDDSAAGLATTMGL